jgi:hypothetical protein
LVDLETPLALLKDPLKFFDLLYAAFSSYNSSDCVLDGRLLLLEVLNLLGNYGQILISLQTIYTI